MGYMAQDCKDLKEDYQWQIRSQYHGPILTTSLSVEMTIYAGTKRRWDIDNFNKLVFDALSGLVYEDDSQIETLLIRKDYDKEKPRVDLVIHTCNETASGPA
jgi:Holliday junction resolvase RusA-like endonuclease